MSQAVTIHFPTEIGQAATGRRRAGRHTAGHSVRSFDIKRIIQTPFPYGNNPVRSRLAAGDDSMNQILER